VRGCMPFVSAWSRKKREIMLHARKSLPADHKRRKGAYGVLRGSPIVATHARGERKRIATERLSLDDNRRAGKRRKDESSPEISSSSSAKRSVTELIAEVERNHRAVATIETARARGPVTHDDAERIAAAAGVLSGRTLRRWAKKAKDGESLLLKPGSGAEPSVLTDDFGEIVQELMMETRGCWTVRSLTKAYNLEAKKRKVSAASRASVGRWISRIPRVAGVSRSHT